MPARALHQLLQARAAKVTLHDLAALSWDRLDLLGWVDRKAPLRFYVVLPLDDDVVDITFRAAEATAARCRVSRARCCGGLT